MNFKAAKTRTNIYFNDFFTEESLSAVRVEVIGDG